MVRAAALLFFFTLLGPRGLAQPCPASPTGQIMADSIRATPAGTPYRIWTYRSEGATCGGRWPTLYVLDGEAHMLPVVGVVANLRQAQRLPPLRVVGIAAHDRTAELTPTQDEEVSPTSGQADAFLHVLEQGLIPHTDALLGAGAYNVLVGHSLGGLFALHALTRGSEVFDSYLALSPSLWWDEQVAVDQLASFLTARPASAHPTHLFLSLANEVTSVASFRRSETLLQAHQPTTLGWTARFYPHHDHITTVIPAVVDALLFTFAPFNLDPLYAAGSLPLLQARLTQIQQTYGFPAQPDPVQLATMGRRHTAQGDPTQAIEILAYGANLYPDMLMMSNYLGEAYQQAGHYHRALDQYQVSRGLALRSGSPMLRWIDRRMAETRRALTQE